MSREALIVASLAQFPHGRSARTVLILALAGMLLVSVVLLQARRGFEVSLSGKKVDLHAALAVVPSGWTVRELPLGATEVLQKTTENTLRFDSWLLREYQRGDLRFTLYAAHWVPGKHPPQMIAQHVPDRCWTMNGMVCEEMRSDVPFSVGRVALWPAQWRKFKTPTGEVIYTIFWHVVGNRPYDFGNRFYDVPSPVTFWSEALRFFIGSRPEQYFV